MKGLTYRYLDNRKAMHTIVYTGSQEGMCAATRGSTSHTSDQHTTPVYVRCHARLTVLYLGPAHCTHHYTCGGNNSTATLAWTRGRCREHRPAPSYNNLLLKVKPRLEHGDTIRISMARVKHSRHKGTHKSQRPLRVWNSLGWIFICPLLHWSRQPVCFAL